MHFQIQMKIRLRRPMEMSASQSGTGLRDGRPVVGYYITMKVNASDAADAVTLAQTIALAPPDRSGNARSFDGIVEEVELATIEPEGGPAHVRHLLAPMDQRGVYYKTGLMYFHEGEDAAEPRKWWQFWKR
jgi:hypothetical protein